MTRQAFLWWHVPWTSQSHSENMLVGWARWMDNFWKFFKTVSNQQFQQCLLFVEDLLFPFLVLSFLVGYTSHLILHEKHPCFKVFLHVSPRWWSSAIKKLASPPKMWSLHRFWTYLGGRKDAKKSMGYPWEKSPGHEIQTINRFMRFYDNLSWIGFKHWIDGHPATDRFGRLRFCTAGGSQICGSYKLVGGWCRWLHRHGPTERPRT